MPNSKPLPSGQEKTSKTKQDVSPSTTGKSDTSQDQSTREFVTKATIAAVVVILAASYSTLSQLTLSPVYGSLPSATFHRQGMLLAALLGWFGGNYIKAFGKLTSILPVLACSIPTIQFFMFPLSSRFGAINGPLITELLTYYPLVFLSASTAAVMFKGISDQHGKSFLVSYIVFTSVDKAVGVNLPNYIGSNIVMTRVGLQYVSALIYSISIPSKWLLLAIPSLLFSAGYNVHVPSSHTTAILNTEIQSDGYVLLHRQESLTGYLSVLQNEKANFRVMRCDHSLLGGEWLPPAEAPKPVVRDPVYAVFTMLEAVRLVKRNGGKSKKADRDSNALVIGLGIGTMPTALAAHGINTTAIEIDPAVHELAMEYFGFPRDLPTLIEDAVGFVERSRNAVPTHRYDYIVHDVFTGGVEPVELFTLQFMQGLHDLLKDDGAVAINYAGDLALPSAGLIVRTIKAVFPSCRIFRENERPSDTSENVDFTNMIIFCKKTDSRLEFRRPVKADYLGSRSREADLLPQFEIDPVTFEGNGDGNDEVLGSSPPPKLRDWQFQSALGHWEIMRHVIPANVWERW